MPVQKVPEEVCDMQTMVGKKNEIITLALHTVYMYKSTNLNIKYEIQ